MSITMNYTRISIAREDLFQTTRVGFVAQRIGTLWCEGYVISEMLPMLSGLGVNYTTI